MICEAQNGFEILEDPRSCLPEKELKSLLQPAMTLNQSAQAFHTELCRVLWNEHQCNVAIFFFNFLHTKLSTYV